MCGCAAIPQTRLVSPLPCALRSHQRIALRRPNPPSRHATTRRPFATLLTASPTFHHAFVTLSSRPFVTPRVAVRDFGPKMATKPRSGTDRPPRARVRNSRPGLLPGAPSEGAPESRLFVPERGSVAIFGPFSRMRTPTCPARPTRRRARPSPEASLPACDIIPVLLSHCPPTAMLPHPRQPAPKPRLCCVGR